MRSTLAIARRPGRGGGLMARRLVPLRPEALSDAQRRLYDAVIAPPRRAGALVEGDGSVRGPFDPMLRSPSIGLPLQAVGLAIRFDSALAADLRELAILLTAAAWGCDFEWSVHEPLAIAAGVDPDELVAIRAGRQHALSAPRHQLVERAAAKLLDRRGLPEALYGELTEELGVQQTFELIATFGYYSTLAMIMKSYDISD